MELNPEISLILNEYGIDRSEGTLCLLAYYYNLEAEKVCSEETVKAVTLTKIVERDYMAKTNTLIWNVPLFSGQQTEFDWIRDWVEPFRRLNADRVGSIRDITARMKEFFTRNPHIRKDDVYKARDNYLVTVKDAQYLKSPVKFIYEGAGGSKTSMLLGFCEKVIETSRNTEQRGRIAT